MRLKILFLTIFALFIVSFLNSGEPEYPKIVNVEYDVQMRKSPYFMDFLWYTKIQGIDRTHRMELNVIMLDKQGNILYEFKELVEIKPKELQIFDGVKIIKSSIIKNLDKVSFKLGLISKKY